MTFICIQAGHEGRTTGATGAPGEVQTNIRIRNKLSELLIARGFMVQLVAADPPDSEIKKDFDLFLSLHCDANTASDGGCIGYIDPAIDSSPESNAESKRLKEAIESVYFQETGIANRPNKVTTNMTRYYMWKRLTANTHCVLLEMGESLDAHDQVILNDTDMVAKAIAKGICKAYGVNYEPTPTPTPTPQPPTDPCEAIKKELETTKKALFDAQKDFSDKLALKDKELLNLKETYNKKISDFIKTI